MPWLNGLLRSAPHLPASFLPARARLFMRLRIVLLLCPVLAVALPLGWLVLRSPELARAAAENNAPARDFSAIGLPFLTQHCISCHGPNKKKADLSLDLYHDDLSVLKDRKRWESVLQMVQSGEMPPETRPRPAPGDIQAF